jgi:hypothetical protein
LRTCKPQIIWGPEHTKCSGTTGVNYEFTTTGAGVSNSAAQFPLCPQPIFFGGAALAAARIPIGIGPRRNLLASGRKPPGKFLYSDGRYCSLNGAQAAVMRFSTRMRHLS